MRIVFLGDAQAEHLRRWSRLFSDFGHEVHVITWNPTILDGFGPVAVHLFQKFGSKHDSSKFFRLINLVSLTFGVRRLISEIRPELLHAHSAGAYAWLATNIGFHPVIVTPWGDDVLIAPKLSAVDRFLTARALRRADIVHCDGENTRKAIIKLGTSRNNIFMASFGVDVRRFRPGNPPDYFLDRYDLHNSSVVVSTRTLNPVHDVETLIRAIPVVLQQVPNCKFLIVGGGAEEKALRSLAGSLGVLSSVRFTGHVEEEEMINCLKSAKVYVSTSLSESGLAASTAEAMACGLAVVNTDTGDIRAWLENGAGGFVVPVKNPTKVSERIVHLLKHDDELTRAALLNRQRIERSNNVHIEMKRIDDLYRRTVKDHQESKCRKLA